MIKVADLLHTPGSSDNFIFQDKQSNRFPYPIEQWISTHVRLTWLNDTDLHIEIEDVYVQYTIDCDRCWNQSFMNITIDYEDTIASTDTANQETLPIDKKNERVSLENWIVDLLILKIPVKSLCKSCEKQWLDSTDEMTTSTWIIRKH